MKNIQVKVINEAHNSPAGMMMFLARLTQKGHTINSMTDLENLYDNSMDNHKSAKAVSNLPHGTIKRFSPITVAIVGASRRFLAQIRTHHVGIDFVSASLQYSDYSTNGQYTVPFEILEAPEAIQEAYAKKCDDDILFYKYLVDEGVDNDAAGYTMNQALRNVLIIQGNHDAWMNLIKLRSCHRNTPETQYVTLLVWEALLGTNNGQTLFAYAGPFCKFGPCQEGSMSCGNPIKSALSPRAIIDNKWGHLLG